MPGQWLLPILISLPELPYPPAKGWETAELRVVSEEAPFILRVGEQTVEFSLQDQLLDHDTDGLPNMVEDLLGTDAANPDSDGDDKQDGSDTNPLTPLHKSTDELAEIREAVFTVMFSTTSSLDAIVMLDRDDFATQEYRGYGGVILRSSTIRRGFVHITGLDVEFDSPTTATAAIVDWEDNLAASGHVAHLVKTNGKWVVVRFYLDWIS
jgi:hypothetical protein